MKQLFLFLLLIVSIPCSSQWENIGFSITNGDPGETIMGMGVHDTFVYISLAPSSFDSGGVHRFDWYHGWVPADTGINKSQGNITTFASLGRYFFAAPSGHRISVTTDDGAYWNPANAASPFCSNGTYLLGQYFIPTTLIRSSDSGKDWDSINNLAVNSFAVNGASILAATSTGYWHSVDGGVNWVKTPAPPSGLSLSAFAVINSQIFAGGVGVFRSTDSGQQWSQISLSNRTVHSLAAYKTYLFAGTDSGVFVSLDSGVSWKNHSEGMGAQPKQYPSVTFLAVLDTTLYAAVDAGSNSGFEYGYATARPISEMVNEAKSAVQQLPQTTATLAIYPNPLTNTATISYTLAEASPVTITIYDALGKTISIPVPGNEETSGEHEVTFDAQSLPSGTYWCHLSAGSVERVAKLVIGK